MRPLATASKSTQTDPILDHIKSLKDKSLALKRLAFSKKFSIELEVKKTSDLQAAAQVTSQVCIRTNC